MSRPLPTLYIPHGGGPCFFMDWTMGPPDTWDKMAAWLRQLGATLEMEYQKPDAVVVFSAHWECERVTINSAPKPSLIYDYYNFPPHTYDLRYPAAGHPQLARNIASLLNTANIDCQLDAHHGFDHGVFIPFLLIYPSADIPIVQVSLKTSLDAAEHLAIGAALAPLRQENILLVGSGFSYHNMEGMMSGVNDSTPIPASEQFDRWLTITCALPATERNQALRRWQQAPGARAAHPREEHLLPLMIAAGAATTGRGLHIYRDQVLGAVVSGFQFC